MTPIAWTQDLLKSYITDNIEEGLTLEYKSGEALEKGHQRQKEIAKDVSAMANSAGGLIIYGIKEGVTPETRHKPMALHPVNRQDCSKETLEQIISSNIQPRISGIKIYPVPLDSDPQHVAYVVKVPQSDTVHQVTRNKRYYKRFNFESVPMADYEIRDVLNRISHSDVESRIGHMSYEATDDGNRWRIPIFAKNSSLTVAKDTAITVEFYDLADSHKIEAERFRVKTQPRPSPFDMYIATFSEAVHRGMWKYFGTFFITIDTPQAFNIRVQVFADGMRAKWWLVKLNFGETSATIQVLDEGYLY